MNILGINAFHGDASACLIRDGKIIAAAEEERFRRIKHWAGFPSEAIRYCLAEGGIALGDVEHIALNQDAKANLGKKIAYTLLRRPDLSLVLDRLRNKRQLKECGGRLGINKFADVTTGEEIAESALDAMLDLKEGADKSALESAMKDHMVGYGELIGTYSKTQKMENK